jgi:hypothetical protein
MRASPRMCRRAGGNGHRLGIAALDCGVTVRKHDGATGALLRRSGQPPVFSTASSTGKTSSMRSSR